MNKLKKGDEVLVISGRDKGKRGIISARIGIDLALVDGINMVKKHRKPNPSKNEPGGIVQKEMPIHISNLAIFNPESNAKDSILIKTSEDGKKIRIFRSSKAQIGVSKK
ncbi:MAG: 50S ribosomal protein L24 [Betaproteobacteria bacterium TMED82]|nr:MAG: 50S ribosomal protein L24 [Betaproteobacteria bacterium TMED82]